MKQEEKIKILAYYLPQFHEIPENNKWWGKGFTEWVNVRKAEPLFAGHNQPRKPLNDNYYDLSNVENMRWQAKIAKENGVYGFCFYHYWFDDRPLLETPLLNYLNDSECDLPYCFCWANESWNNGWAKKNSSVIMEQKYGDKETWKKHFDFLLPFFSDGRYIKENNSPLIVIYRPYLYSEMEEMIEYWKQLAIENGFNGLVVASQRFEDPDSFRQLYNYLDYHISYEPNTIKKISKKESPFKYCRKIIHDFLLEKLNIDISIRQEIVGPTFFDYDITWSEIINKKPNNKKDIAGAFVNWDNTPRHSKRGSVFLGVTPKKFEYYMEKQIENVLNNYDNDYLFLFAWNEWGEGGILEPDSVNGFDYLHAIKKAIVNSRRNSDDM